MTKPLSSSFLQVTQTACNLETKLNKTPKMTQTTWSPYRPYRPIRQVVLFLGLPARQVRNGLIPARSARQLARAYRGGLQE